MYFWSAASESLDRCCAAATWLVRNEVDSCSCALRASVSRDWNTAIVAFRVSVHSAALLQEKVIVTRCDPLGVTWMFLGIDVMSLLRSFASARPSAAMRSPTE